MASYYELNQELARKEQNRRRTDDRPVENDEDED
jgi:hypothetical protein